jgi:enterochelin esterase-like enzyme
MANLAFAELPAHYRHSAAQAQSAPAPQPSAPTMNIGQSVGRGWSAEVATDGQVTFRFAAPKAQSVRLITNWPGPTPSAVPMTKNAQGEWSITIGPMRPGWWTYSFDVDGVAAVDPTNPRVRSSQNQFASLLYVPGEASADYALAPVPHGTVSYMWYPTTGRSKARRAMVYTPPGYGVGNDRYPVLYLLHGMTQNEEAWAEYGMAPQVLDNLIAKKRIAPMIVVFPNNQGNEIAAQEVAPPLPVPAPPQEFYLDDVEHDVVHDLIPYVDAAYRTQANATDRAIAGLSMGGGNSFYIAFRNLEKFGWVGAFSSGFHIITPPGVPLTPTARLWNVDAGVLSAALPQFNAQETAKLRLLYGSIGAQDRLMPMHEQLKAIMRDKGIRAPIVERPGYIHEWAFWRWTLSDFLPRIFHAESDRPQAGVPARTP